MKRGIQIFLLMGIFLLSSTRGVSAQQASNTKNGTQKAGSAIQLARGAAGTDWPAHGGTNLNWSYSSLSQVNTTNVDKLSPAWIFQTGDFEVGLQSTPIVINGIIYLSAVDDVFAIDGATGRQIWRYTYEPLPGFSRGRNWGVAVANGKVFLNTRDAHLVALDQKTGEEVWSVATADATSCVPGCSGAAAPLVADDKVIVSSKGPRGEISAFDIKTGHLAWRFYTIPGPGEKGHETWSGDSWKKGDVNPWQTGSFDPALNLIYWGTGGPVPTFFGDTREGDNLYGECILALNKDTGKLRWYYQETPHGTWDFDATYEMVLLEHEVRGQMRNILVQFSKSGFTFVLDRETGEPLKIFPFVDNYNWTTGYNEKGELLTRHEYVTGKVKQDTMCPGHVGGKSWNHVAYSPRTGLFYSPTLEICNDLTSSPSSSSPATQDTWRAPPGHDYAYSHLDAVDVLTGKRQWSYQYKYGLFASIIATEGDLIFTGDPEG